jgi:hypothetical protein
MGKMRAREVAAAEMHPSSAAEVHAPAVHAATAVHAAAAAMATATAVAPATTAASSERRRRKSQRRNKHTSSEAIEELVVHPDPSVVELQRRKPSQQEGDQKTPMMQ